MPPPAATSSARNQYLAGGLVLCTSTFSIGAVLGFSAILLPQLEEEAILSSKDSHASWIASISNVGHLVSSVLFGFIAAKIGCKKGLIVSSVPLLASWTIIGLSNGSFTLIIIGRILQGAGVMSSLTQVYLVEISDAARRGIIAGSGALFVSLGILSVYIAGALLPWRWVCLVFVVIPMVHLCIMPFMPDSPTWLMHQGREEEALKALKWLRGSQGDVSEELASLRPVQDKQQDLDATPQGPGDVRPVNRESNLWQELRQPHAYKPFLLLLATFILQQSTGTFTVIFYAVDVFRDIGVATDPYTAAILTGLIRVVATFLGAVLLKSCSRKKLMISSALSMAFFLCALGITVQSKQTWILSQDSFQNVSVFNEEEFFTNDSWSLQKGSYDHHLATNPQIINHNETRMDDDDDDKAQKKMWSQMLEVLPLVEVIGYMLSFGLGIGTVPWLLLGELCPVQVKAFTSGVVACTAYVTIFLVVKMFPFMVASIGTHGAYYFYAIMCVITAIFSACFVPETKGKPLAQLQNWFRPQSHEP